MPVTKDKILLFQSHECSSGLDDEAMRDICDAAELQEYAAGEYLHQSNQPIDSVHLVVHGRLKQSIVDMHGNILLQRFLTRGGQFGALAAAQAEPVPIEVVAVEPSAVLKLDFESTLRFTRKHETFGLNLTRSLSNMIHQVLLQDRRPKKPSLVTIFHESPASRPLTQRVVDRLVELGESPSVMSDCNDWAAVENVRSRSLMENGQLIGRDDIRRQINAWPDSERVILDVDSALDPVNSALCVEFSEQVFWCTSSQGIESSTYRLKAVEGRAPGWRDKINLVWILEADQRTSPPAAELNRLVGRDFKVSTSETQPDQGRALLDGFERLIHQLRGVRIGLALGGGGARGMAHLGVLKALESSGLVVDRIAGTSAGAMTGTIYAAGFGADYVTERFVEDLKPGWPFRMMPRGDYWYLLYKSASAAMPNTETGAS